MTERYSQNDVDPNSLSDQELVEAFRSSEVSSQAVMGRLLDKLDLSEHGSEVLKGEDGNPLIDDGKEVLVVDYIDHARTKDIAAAEAAILNFVAMPPESEQYAANKRGMEFIVRNYLRLDTAKGE